MAAAQSEGGGARYAACLQCTQHCHQTHGQGLPTSHIPSFYSLLPSSSPSAPLILPIPPAFLGGRGVRIDLESSANEPLHSEVQLKGPSGEIWNVSMQGLTLGNLAFTKGWEEFVTDHGLSVGDLLFFKLLSRGFFSVTIYGNDGCEKADAFTVQNSGARLMANAHGSKKRPTVDKVLDCESVDVETKRRKVRCDKQIAPPIIDIDDDEDQEDDLIILSEVESGNHNQSSCMLAAEEQVTGNANQGSCMLPAEEQVTDSANQGSCMLAAECSKDTKEDTLSHLNLVELPPTPSNADKSNLQHDRLKAFMAKDYMTEAFISKRRPVSAEERQKTLLAAKRFKSNRPHLRKLMKESHVYRGFWLSLSADFSSEHLPSEIQEATLLDASGKAWSARWLGSRGGLSGGWRKFSLDHGLEEGDVCVFELIDKNKLVIKVHVFRVVELRNELPGRDHYLRKPQSKPLIGYSPSTRKSSSSLIGYNSRKSSGPAKKMRGAIASRNTRNVAEDTPCEDSPPTSREPLPENLSGMPVARQLDPFFNRSENRLLQSVSMVASNSSREVASREPLPENLSGRAVVRQLDPLFNSSENRLLQSVSKVAGTPKEVASRDPLPENLRVNHLGTQSASKLASSSSKEVTSREPLPENLRLNHLGRAVARQLDPLFNRSENRLLQSASKLASTSSKELAHDSQAKASKKYYTVERLFNRRKGIVEEEFLVELEGETSTASSSLVKREGSAWWVPLSHFTKDKMSCHL